MIKTVEITNTSSSNSRVTVKYCDTFWSNFIGLMNKKELKPEEGIVLVESNESIVNTSIHMLFMKFDIAVLWLDRDMVIVDKVLAKRWRPFYIPKKPAQYVLELHHSKFHEYSIGDKLSMVS